MEKKTIGKFISALRRANGMTQKDLGDKLFVSDKTVSRWERDECAPDISLIPIIADLFGVTSDEIIRGERNAQGAVSEDADGQLRKKSEKQYRALISSKCTRYKNLSLISFGIGALGVNSPFDGSHIRSKAAANTESVESRRFCRRRAPTGMQADGDCAP